MYLGRLEYPCWTCSCYPLSNGALSGEKELCCSKLVCLLLGNNTKEYLINEVCFPLGITASFDQSPLEIAFGSIDILCNSSLAWDWLAKLGKAKLVWGRKERRPRQRSYCCFCCLSHFKERLCEIGFSDAKKTLAVGLFFCRAYHALHAGSTCKK